MRIIHWSAGVIAFACCFAPALARDVQVKVPATAMPWNPGVNRKMDFGRHDGTRPVITMGGVLIAGSRVDFEADGETTTVTGGGGFGPSGQQEFVTDANLSGSGVRFPSSYVDPARYPVHLNALVGAFIDADGKVIGRPFVIGAATSEVVPEGTMAIAMGINDDMFSDNQGALTVKVHIPEVNVTVEPGQ